MKTSLKGPTGTRSLLLAVFLTLTVIGFAFAGGATARTQNRTGQVSLPTYGDTSPWGKYFRQLQDTTATKWYQEVNWYSYRSSVSRGVVTAQFLISPNGHISKSEILSNTANAPMGQAVLRALQKTWMQPFPADVAAMAPKGLTVKQTFRLWDYDPTNYGWASSYPQILTRRSPEIGGAWNLDIKKYPDLTRFKWQSRIIDAQQATGHQDLAQR